MSELVSTSNSSSSSSSSSSSPVPALGSKQRTHATGVKRVKSGCITCRIRKVKCDERKPECQKCLSTGRKCDGYSSLPFSRSDLRSASSSSTTEDGHPLAISGDRSSQFSRLITDPAFSDLLDKRYFQFFRHRTVQSTNALVDCRFWDRLVPQACHSEPAVRHAILALSSLHQIQGDDEGTAQHLLYASKQYQKALTAAQALIASSKPRDVDRVLIACILFTCFESTCGNYNASALHMHSGRTIMAQHRERLRSSRRNDWMEIEQMFARLDLAAITFQNDSSPYDYSMRYFHATKPKLFIESFDSLEEARASLVDTVRWQLILATSSMPYEHYLSAQADLRRQTELWYEYFSSLIERTKTGETPVVLALRLWHSALVLHIEAGFFGPETRFDPHLSLFEQLVMHGERLVNVIAWSNASHFSPDLGYTPPLFVAASRCRDPHLRRRAIAALLKNQRSEGNWDARGAAAVLERWMQVEEEGLPCVRSAQDIPEHQRINDLGIKLDRARGTAWMDIRLRSEDGSASGEVREEVVRWEGPGCHGLQPLVDQLFKA